MAAGEFHVYYRLISNSDCGWGSFVCHWPVSRSNVPQNLLLRRPFKGGNANKEQRWQVSQTKSHGYLSTSATHIWWNTLNLQIMYPLFQWQQVKKKPHRPIHLQHFAFYKAVKGWSHRDSSGSNCGHAECWSGLVFNGGDMWTVNSAIRAEW